ncbi:coiled-coil domain-containing protein 112-like [Gigantopelta aegis]|uniref:coiled-coil domain-containing protein 112-like n=1 Tax=Gigantopelta aegis TaxID=1735272 RepID=UPI001B88AD33|nr:coiled-coil domain-containing protein 112-like [Gigantopelta aegis]
MASKGKETETSSALRCRNNQTKKTETLREIHKLAVQIQALEGEKGTHIYSKRNDFYADFRQLEETDSKQTSERKTEGIKLRQQLDKISHMVKRFQRELRDVKPTPEFVTKLKSIMEDIESTINTFKEQQRSKYEELMKEERTTSQELHALEKRFESWSQVPDPPTSSRVASSRPPASARDVTKDLPPEVAQFEKFLQQSGGVRGGWDEYDHQTFLKFRSRYKGKIVFVDHLKPALPTRTEAEIREHEVWYEEYLFLNDVKKDSIKKWRMQKEEHKDEVIIRAQEDVSMAMQSHDPSTLDEQTQAERHEKLVQLNAWKVQKELEKAQESERKLREELNLKRKKEEDRKRQLAIKAQVEENRRQREEEEEFLRRQKEMWEEEETERKRQISAREIAKFRERDLNAVHQKVQKEKEQKELEREKERRLERIKQQVEAGVTRDPSRLIKPTQGWKQRLKEIGPSGSGPVLQIPHRAVPSWRQGMH